jgi:hypothetical protein
MGVHEIYVSINKKMRIEFTVVIILCTVFIYPCLTDNITAEMNIGYNSPVSDNQQFLTQEGLILELTCVATIQVWLSQESRNFYSQIIITKAAFRSFPRHLL